MPYRLPLDAPIPDGLRRTATERLDHAIDALRTQDDPATAVHEARKDVKKIRSLLRLVRDGLGRDLVRDEQLALRNASGLLAASRDAEVMAQTTADLARRFAGRLPHSAFTAAAEAASPATGRPGDDAGEAEARDAAAAALEAVRARVQEWPLERCDRETLVVGLERSYRRGRRGLRPARAGDAEQLHAWRKRVKDLWYQQRLLQDAWPAVLAAQAEEAHVLTEHLGDHHDLHVLREALLAAPDDPPQRDDVVALIDLRSAELLDDALRLGARVYAERPGAFTRRLRRYLRTG